MIHKLALYFFGDKTQSKIDKSHERRLKSYAVISLCFFGYFAFQFNKSDAIIEAKTQQNAYLQLEIDSINESIKFNDLDRNVYQEIVKEAFDKGLHNQKSIEAKNEKDKQNILAISDTISEASIKAIFAKYYGRQHPDQ